MHLTGDKSPLKWVPDEYNRLMKIEKKTWVWDRLTSTLEIMQSPPCSHLYKEHKIAACIDTSKWMACCYFIFAQHTYPIRNPHNLLQNSQQNQCVVRHELY